MWFPIVALTTSISLAMATVFEGRVIVEEVSKRRVRGVKVNGLKE